MTEFIELLLFFGTIGLIFYFLIKGIEFLTEHKPIEGILSLITMVGLITFMIYFVPSDETKVEINGDKIKVCQEKKPMYSFDSTKNCLEK